ncbi:TetR/AcrR family transcriptional regulator [Nocardia jejuensis]|uniref:TetR/AcrR family transcriptional regulator n=1 Tax=Nocardia jejuensis TaxID=328049 RepID=UPI00082C5A02|nr:TetR/AcrR family transcriptional regulator [Nocardia jejuensis]
MVVQAVSEPVVAGRSTKDAIRDAAIRLFSSKGFEQSSLREVADAVGITKASLYYHYASKVDLLDAIIEPMFEDMQVRVDALAGLEHSPDTVRDVLTSHLRAMLAHRTIGVLCMRDTVAIVNALGKRHPDMMENHRTMCEWLAGPDADQETILRSAAAMQVLGAAFMSKEGVPDMSLDGVERVLLEAALSVLNRK